MRRRVGFNVAPDGSISPSVPQYGGVKGEHGVTELGLTLASLAPYRDGDLVRLRFAGGDGSVLSSDLIEEYIAEDGRMTLSYALPAVLTRVGGQLGVRLVLSRIDENGTETETFLSAEAVLWFDEAPTENGTPFWTGVSEMLKRTATASQTAVAARDAARDHGEAAAADADRAARFAEAALQAAEEAQAVAGAVARIEQNAADIQTLMKFVYALQSGKLEKSGHTPNKYLGTDGQGNAVTRDGVPYTLTEAEKEALVQAVLAQVPSGEEVAY